ncbi:MAG: ribosome recycling factor [Atribacterota bacterium]|nr:ribosome recycling factor [Atribacterota bacterium]
MLKVIINETEDKMKKAIKVLKDELSHMRTGRASTALIENIKIEYYGTETPLRELANLAVPEAELIVIQPWDKTIINVIEKSIWKADIGITPNNDGNVIRLTIPPMTEDRRKEIAKLIKKEAEAAKVAVRNVRRDINDKIKKMGKNSDISEDQSKEVLKEVQEITDRYTKDIDEIYKAKEVEIMKV